MMGLDRRRAGSFNRQSRKDQPSGAGWGRLHLGGIMSWSRAVTNFRQSRIGSHLPSDPINVFFAEPEPLASDALASKVLV